MLKILKPLLCRKFFAIKSEGLSMLPILHPNDVVRYKKSSSNKLRLKTLLKKKKTINRIKVV